MADEAYLRKVVELQSEFFKRLEVRDTAPRLIIPSLLVHLLKTDDEVVDMSLGKVGRWLKSFAQEVDFGHPDLSTVFDGALSDERDFSQHCIELLSLAEYARTNQMTRIVPLLGQVVTKDKLDRGIAKKIESPLSSRLHVRLLKDAPAREEIRSLKRMQTIDLAAVYRKGEDAWRAQPEDFRRFLRFDTAYQEEIQKAEKKAKRYSDLGCSSLAEEIMKAVETFREHMEQAYYGFNRITMTNAAVILAKSLCYVYNPQTIYSLADDSAGKIVVPRKFFGKYNFDQEFNPLEYEPLVPSLDGTPVYCQRYAPPLAYEPRVYPLHQFMDIAPPDVVNMIQTLEAFPDAGGKPIFDHFGVIVPGVALPDPSAISFLDESGQVKIFGCRDEAMRELDRTLTKGGYFHPIVVGERDGKCYFICYFSSKGSETTGEEPHGR